MCVQWTCVCRVDVCVYSGRVCVQWTCVCTVDVCVCTVDVCVYSGRVCGQWTCVWTVDVCVYSGCVCVCDSIKNVVTDKLHHALEHSQENVKNLRNQTPVGPSIVGSPK